MIIEPKLLILLHLNVVAVATHVPYFPAIVTRVSGRVEAAIAFGREPGRPVVDAPLRLTGRL